ncbi:uncharacterized protein LOC113332389 [Papaver somniferum]|uniref:uncharacterized protein LOC113332389 n=1 Tax=Papaver somniferum TaxID=3469 RepID=UPI000E6F5CEE|nr:uncharacterized protein LOC113332389 [Papaver somniferum]
MMMSNSNMSRRSREGNPTTPKPTMKTIKRMEWINPISWAAKLLSLLHIKGKTRRADLPRNIILDILSRLPAKLIYKCQCESRPLQVLTTEVVQIVDNELLLRQRNRLVLYNMLSHACKISEIIGSMDKGIRAVVYAPRIASFHL